MVYWSPDHEYDVGADGWFVIPSCLTIDTKVYRAMVMVTIRRLEMLGYRFEMGARGQYWFPILGITPAKRMSGLVLVG